MTRYQFIASCLFFSFAIVPLSLKGDEIKGTVAAIGEGTINVATDSQLLPNAGDKAEVGVEIPGLDELAMVASGKVTEVTNEVIVVKIDRSPGKIAVGQQVRITSENPKQRTASEPTKETMPTKPSTKTDNGPAIKAGEAIVLHGHPDATIGCVAFSPDGRQILSASLDGSAVRWDLDGQELSRLKVDGYWTSMAFSPDGKLLLVGADDGTLQLWDFAAGSMLRTFSGHSATVRSVNFSADGRYAVSAGGIFYDGPPADLGIGEERPAEVQRVDCTVRIWDVQTGRELQRFSDYQFPVTSARFSPDGRKVISGCRDRGIRIYDLSSGNQIHRLEEPFNIAVLEVAFSPDGRQVLSLSGTGADFEISRALDRSQRGQPLSTDEITNLLNDAEPDSAQDFAMRLWDAGSGKELRFYKGHADVVSCAEFSSDGREILTGSWDSSVRVWDTASGSELLSLLGHTSLIQSVAFSPDGSMIVSGDQYGEIRVWKR
jgi:WD40 repeat protein